MLILSRKPGEEVLVGDKIRVTIVAVHGNQVRLGFTAPEEIAILRREFSEAAGPVLRQGPREETGAGVAAEADRLEEEVVEFSLLLPAGQAAALEAAARRHDLTVAELIRRLIRDFRRHDSKRILVVEDDDLTRETLTLFLQSEGYRVSEAANGEEALHLLRRAPRPHLILLDLMMPVMSGWDFLDRQRQDPALASIPVVIFSGAGDVGQQASSLGVAGCLEKPIEPGELVVAIQHHAGLTPG